MKKKDWIILAASLAGVVALECAALIAGVKAYEKSIEKKLEATDRLVQKMYEVKVLQNEITE